jgi:KTSC domain
MQVISVGSTALATVGYDEARELLQVEFDGRAIYHYFGVPVAVHQGLLAAPSKGRYFNQAIRGRFPFCLIPELHADASDAQCRPGAAHRR